MADGDNPAEKLDAIPAADRMSKYEISSLFN